MELAVPMTSISTSGTFQLKDKAGYIQSIFCSNQGTSWTLQIFDGPDQFGNTKALLGGTKPFSISTGGFTFGVPMYCTFGIQVVTSGTSGEIDIEWN